MIGYGGALCHQWKAGLLDDFHVHLVIVMSSMCYHVWFIFTIYVWKWKAVWVFQGSGEAYMQTLKKHSHFTYTQVVGQIW